MNRRYFQLTAIIAVVAFPGYVTADIVTDWNAIACDVLVQNTTQQNPGMASRSMAMMNLAIYDTINGIEPRHVPFYPQSDAPVDASVDAAIAQAAYEVLSSIYPDQRPLLDVELANSLAQVAAGASKQSGLAYGSAVANVIINDRITDGFDSMVQYMPTGGQGHWAVDPTNPNQQVWGPEWGDVTPFGITTTRDFMPPPPPALSSQQYADAFNEVKEIGSLDSASRTAEQTNIGLFWAYDRLGMGTPMRLYNQIATTISEDRNNDLHDNARMLAMVFTAAADAGIAAWESKFEYDFWRPINGIRQANEDGNPDTVADPDWVALGAPGGTAPDGSVIRDFTPPFPTYVSGHASFGGAVFTMLETFYGTDEVTFAVESEEVPGLVREFDRFSDAMAENGRSRVYLGIHWNYDDTVARELGADVADHISQNYFHPVPEPTTAAWMLLSLPLLWHRSRFA